MNPNIKFTKKVASVLKALGHSTRVEIIHLLCNKKNQKISVKQIQESLGLGQVEASRHLIVLKNASVLDCDKEGTNSYYFINAKDAFVKNITTCLNKNIA